MKTARMLVILVLALALVVGLCGTSSAVPLGTAFMYQNLLIDGNDVLDGPYDLTVSLFDDPNEGELRGTVFVDDLDVNGGWFEIMLDFGPETFDGSDLWLEFATRPGEMDDPNEYVTLWPRYPILPAPYALYSINTGPIHSLDAEDGYPTEVVYVDKYGEVGIGTKYPSAELDVDGKIKIRGGSPGNGKVLTSNASGLASWQTLPAGGDITAVTPGTGLSGGGTSGPVTLAFSTSWGDSRYVNENQSNSITSAMIADNSITQSDIAAGGVGASEIASGAVGNSELANDVVTSVKIANGAVTSADLASDAVTSAKIQNGTIQQADLAFTPGDITAVTPGTGLSGGGTSGPVTLAFSTSWGDSRYVNENQSNSITSAMIADNSITQSDIADNGVGASEIASGAVVNSKIFKNAVTNTKLADGAVTNAKIANDAVTSSKIQNGTIQQADLAFTPGDITAVNAGIGLSGGGISGPVTLTFVTPWGDSRYVNEGQSNSITSAMIVNDTITASDIADNGVGASEIASGAVTSSKILDGTIQQTDLAFTPGDITEVTAGTGLSGGGTSGNVTLNVDVPLTLSGSNSSHIIRATNYGSGYGVYGYSYNGRGVFGKTNTGHAGYFIGKGYFGDDVGIGTNDPDGRLQVIGDEVRIGNAGTVNYATSDGDLYVEDDLEVDGDVYMLDVYNTSLSGRNVYVSSSGHLGYLASSKRYKENIAPLKEDFSKILQAQPVSFTFKESKERGIGFIAEDLDELGLSKLVFYDAQGRPDSVQYEFVCLYLLEVMKDQAESIEQLKHENASLKKQLQAENESLKKQLTTENQFSKRLEQRLEALERTMEQYQFAVAKEVQQ